ncbi:MAG: hypothetical protein HYX44_01545, partial [Aquabacterium sp.]|nr:hypothetical protein [Aquabacterium sp.]
RFGKPDVRAGSDGGGLLTSLAGAAGLSGVASGLASGLGLGQTQDTITAWSMGQHVGTNALTLAAWDERQLAGVSANAAADIALGQQPTLEHYLGQGERRFADGRVGTPQPASSQAADARAQALMAAHQLQQVRASGQSAVRVLRPGATFELTGHSLYAPGSGAVGSGGAGNAFCATRITHEAANNLGHEAAQIVQRTDVEEGTYRNTFEAVPASARLVPMPQRQPTAPGLQTAVVMAAAGEPLTTDRDHRIRIQFGWQRG